LSYVHGEQERFTALAAYIDKLDEIGRIVYFHRRKSGLSRIQLATLAGVGKTVIYDLEHGKTTLRIETLFRILDALNIKLQPVSPLMELYRGERDAAS
jgi:HTH-type transcriptional regulator / antitoxin HipB